MLAPFTSKPYTFTVSCKHSVNITLCVCAQQHSLLTNNNTCSLTLPYIVQSRAVKFISINDCIHSISSSTI